jgi:hypothetical protein
MTEFVSLPTKTLSGRKDVGKFKDACMGPCSTTWLTNIEFEFVRIALMSIPGLGDDLDPNGGD